MKKDKIKLTKKDKAEEKTDDAIWWQDSNKKKVPQKVMTAVLVLLILVVLAFIGYWVINQKNMASEQQTDKLRKELEESKKATQDDIDALQQKLSAIQMKLNEAEKSKEALAAQKVTVEGSLSYPGTTIPQDMEVCAVDVNDAKNKVCTKEHVIDKKYTYNVGYKLELAPGTYNVYATTANWAGYQAYYNEFVTCGLKYNCPSHDTIDIKVETGKNLTDIDPIDWYKQS